MCCCASEKPLPGLGRGLTIAAGAPIRARWRWTVARDTPGHTDRGGHAAGRIERGDSRGHGTPSLGIGGIPSRSETFLEIDDGFGPRQAAYQDGILPLAFGQQRRQRIGRGGFWTALTRTESLERTGVALPAPIGQDRRVDTLAPQDGADPAMISRAIGLRSCPHRPPCRGVSGAWA